MATMRGIGRDGGSGENSGSGGVSGRRHQRASASARHRQYWA